MFNLQLSIIIGWVCDLVFGDPQRLPHPIVWFGKVIAFFEHRLNHGSHRRLKGAIVSITLILGTFALTWFLRFSIFNFQSSILFLFDSLIIFFCLAGTTLIREVRAVFLALDRSLEEGRAQVARIVGRDTSELTAQEVRTAALETLAENLSDGVIAPLFWLAILGTPGMLAYKMVNTLDSMIGYKTERYKDFGCWAAHIDDVANYLPARLTALLMVLPYAIFNFQFSIFNFVRRYGRNHASPNSGYPEAALAGILDCRFGGPHYYFGQLFPKPYIGDNPRELTTADMRIAIRVNRIAEVLMILLVMLTTVLSTRLLS
jgi:adenosylcobinamide-phosphate synthase